MPTKVVRLDALGRINMHSVERPAERMPATGLRDLADLLLETDAKLDILTDWELDFVADMAVRARNNQSVTAKQVDKLESIYEKHLGRLPDTYKKA